MELELDPADLHDEVNVGAVGADGRPAPPARLSPSGASMFEQCPRRWRFRYVDRLPDPPGIPALVGSFAHLVLEALLQEDPPERTRARARMLARARWSEFEAEYDYSAMELDEAESREFRWRAWKAIEGLWALEDPAAVEVAATEQKVEATLGGVPFRGVVDRIDEGPDGMVVTDYKSGRPPSRRFESKRLVQVLLYAAAVAEYMGRPPVQARLLYLGQRVVDTPVTEETLESTVEALASTWSAIGTACAADAFAPRTGPLCDWCPYAANCPEGTAEIERRAAERAAQEESLLRMAG